MKLEIGKSYGILLPNKEVVKFKFEGKDERMATFLTPVENESLVEILKEGYIAYWEIKETTKDTPQRLL